MQKELKELLKICFYHFQNLVGSSRYLDYVQIPNRDPKVSNNIPDMRSSYIYL